MMISDSASTTSASAAEEVRMVVMLAWVRKTGLTKEPTTISTTSAGTRARSRSRAMAALPIDGRRRRGGDGRVAAVITLRFLRSRRRARCRSSPPCVPRRSPPCRITSTRSQVRRSSSSPLTTRIALPSRRMRSTTASSASLDLTSTPAVGSISTRTDGSLASARPITTFCWLPPERPETSWSGPSVTMPRSRIAARSPARLAAAAR